MSSGVRTDPAMPYRSGTGFGIMGCTLAYLSREIAWKDPAYNRNNRVPLLTWDAYSTLLGLMAGNLPSNNSGASTYNAITSSNQRKPYLVTLNCEHVKSKRGSRPYDCFVKSRNQVNDGTRFYTTPTAPALSFTGDFYCGYAESYPALPSYPVSPSLADFESFANEATDAMYPAMKAEASGFQFFAELPQLALLAMQVRNVSGILASVYESKVTLTAETGLKELAKCDLAYEFGFEILVREVAKLASMTKRASQQLDAFKKRGKLGETRHYTVVEDTVTNVTSNGYKRTASTLRRTWNATWRLKYYASDSITRDAWDLAGMGMTARGAWDLVPFSFVVDKVLRLDGLLNMFDREQRLQIITQDFSVSCKAVSQNVTYIIQGSSAGTNKDVLYVGDTACSHATTVWEPGELSESLGFVIAYSRAQRYSRKRLEPSYGVPVPALRPRAPGGFWAYSLAALGLIAARKQHRNIRRVTRSRRQVFSTRR